MNNVEIVKIVVDDLDEIFHQFDYNDISDELATYIENRCSRLAKNEMCIKIITDRELSNQEKDKIVSAIKCHYGLEIKYVGIDIKKMKRVNIYYFLSGLLTILIANLLSIGPFFVEVIDILGCFIVWESAFNLLFTDNEMDLKIDRAKKISKARIEFDILSI